MMEPRANARGDPRTWIWVAVAIQALGLAVDAVWHGILHPDFEARTVGEMARHLGTVHLPMYVGVLSVLLAAGWALIGDARQGVAGWPVRVAFAGALLSTAGESWHAYSHLRLTPAPIAGSASALGLAVVVATTWLAGRQARREARAAVRRRRAA